MGFELLEQVIVEVSDMLSNLVNQSETVLHQSCILGKKADEIATILNGSERIFNEDMNEGLDPDYSYWINVMWDISA